MLHRHLICSATLVLVVATLAACGQDDLTVAVTENASGASMGVETAAAVSPEVRPDVSSEASANRPAAPVAVDTQDAGVAAPDADPRPAESSDVAPASALEAAAAAARDAVPTATEPAGVDPEAASGSGAGNETAKPPAKPPAVSLTEQPIGDLSDSSEQPALPPVDEPATPPTEAPAAKGTVGNDGSADASEALEDDLDYGNLPDEGEWTPPPIEEPRLVDGVWRVTFDYLGSFDTGMLALPEDSPMAIEARREQQLLEEKPNLSPTGLPPEPDDLPIAPATEIGFPDAVRKIDGQVVRIEGYMIPLKFEDGKVKSFFLSRYMMGCCFGVLPKANEIIEVEMADGKGAFYDAYMPFIVTGKFVIVEEGTDPEYMQSVFRMTADSCEYSEDW